MITDYDKAVEVVLLALKNNKHLFNEKVQNTAPAELAKILVESLGYKKESSLAERLKALDDEKSYDAH